MTDATVIIAAYRAAGTLERSIDSALAQQDVSVEVIVIDDASGDGTADLAHRLAAADSRIRVLGLARNGGPSAARNAGLEAATGDWIAVLDSDDCMVPGRLASLIAFAQDEGADVVFDNLQPVDEEGSPTGTPHLGGERAVRQSWSLEAYVAQNQAEPGTPSLGFLKPVIRRSVLDRTGLRYDPTLRNGEDFHLILALLHAGAKVSFTPAAGYLYTTRSGSVSNRLNIAHAEALAAADAAFLAAHHASLSPRAVALMRRRMGRISDLASAERVLARLKERRLGAAAAALLRRPRTTGRLLVQIREALGRRLGL